MPTLDENAFKTAGFVAFYPVNDSSYADADNCGGNVIWLPEGTAYPTYFGTWPVSWTIYQDGVLTIMKSDLWYSDSRMDGFTKRCPWYQYDGIIKTVVIEPGATVIAEDAFVNLESLTNVTIPDTVTRISSGAFEGCVNLTSITIPGSVEHISNKAFENCTSLSSVELSNGLQSIGLSAFYMCSSLKEITFPETLSQIEDHAFSYCRSMKQVCFTGDLPTVGIWHFMR